VGTSQFIIRDAAAADATLVSEILTRNHQSDHAVLTPGTRYFIAEGGGNAVGVIGLESRAGVALLRSAAVLVSWRGLSIGDALVRRALAAAAADRCSTVYCFSTGAGPYWVRFGFERVSVSELVAALAGAPQVEHYRHLGTLDEEVAWRLRL
jgi:N-acetylglutamate synthase-like GNAT family acetyltransferase